MGRDRLSILILGLLSLQSTCFVFDSEEIKALNFVVDILDQPVLLSETPEERTVQMYNRAGQAYSCLLPDTEPLLQQRREEADAIQHASVPSLLAPMSSGPCLQRTRDWWTYELCPMSEIRQYHMEGELIRQYHMEGGQIVSKVSVLGRFESDYDWSRDDGRSRNAKQRYHSQTYANGSDCDLTGRPRSAEVRYICEEGDGDALVRVDEPETCRYVLTVRTARVCSHRALAPPPGRRPQPVTCRPALSAQQMQRLAEARLERARREAERAARWAADRESREREQEDTEEQERDEEEEEEEVRKQQEERKGVGSGGTVTSYLEKARYLFDGIAAQTKKLGNILDNILHSYIHIVSKFNAETEYGVERLHALRERHRTARYHHADHAQRIRDLFELAEAGHYDTEQILQDLIAYSGTLSIFSEVTMGISEESRRLKEFISSDPSLMTDSTLGELVKTMANLSSLSIELKRFFTDTEAMQADLRTWQADLTELARSALKRRDRSPPGHTSSHQPAGHGAEQGSEDGTQQSLDSGDPDTSEAVNLLTSRPGRSADERPSSAEDGPVSSEDSEEDDQSEDEEDELTGEEGRSTDASKKGRVKFPTLSSLGLDKMVQVSEIDRDQRARIERAVKQKLGKVGLDTNGPQIKVRFLKLPDLDHLDKEHTLTEEEMATFENAIITIMMGGNEALVEHDKHNQQADNYEYSFDRAVQDLETEQDEEPADETPAIDESLFTLV